MWRWLTRFSGDRGPPEGQQRSLTLPRNASESPSPSPWRDGVSSQKKANTMDNAHEVDGTVSDAATPLKRSRFDFLRPRRWRTLSFSRNSSKLREGKSSGRSFSPDASTRSSPARQVSGQKPLNSERPVRQANQSSTHGLPTVSSQSSSRASTLSDKDITPTTEERKPFKTLEKKGAAAARPGPPSMEERPKRSPSASKRRAKRPQSPPSPLPQSPSVSLCTTSSSGRPSRRDAKSRTLTKPSFLHFAKQAAAYDPLTAEANQSFLRAARAGNIGKITEYLNSNVDLNAVNSNGLNALHLASKEGHLAVVRLLLDHNAVIDAKTKKGNTSLHIASLAGRADIVRLLMERGADVNARSQNGFTPLYMAAQENHTDIVQFLLNKGANQALATDDGFTPLAVALQQGHDGIVALLLDRDAGSKGRLPALHIAAKKDDVHAATLLLANSEVNVNHTSAAGFTALHIAAHHGNVNVARLLISNGADVNFNAKNNITPLHVAAKWGKAEMVKLLIDRGANVNARTRDDLTPMHCASRSGNMDIVQILLAAGADHTLKTRNGLSPIHMAAQGDYANIVKLLLRCGSSPDEATLDYLRPIHIAAHCGHVSVAQTLLENNCDVNSRALNGFTPLHVACKKMKVKVVELLLKHGAAVEATTQAGFTPLHVAAFVGCTEAAVLLLQRGANPNQITTHGETPLYLAVRGRHLDTIRALLKNSALVDARVRDHQTALHVAIRAKDVEIVQCLLDAGADVNAEARGKYRPLHLAVREGDLEMIRLLLNHGAQVEATTKRGYTAMHIAAKYDKLDVMQLLITEGRANVDAAARNGLTPLHVATFYGFADVANLLLHNGAKVNVAGKNGFTPLHQAAKLASAEIASSLLKAGAVVDEPSRNGYTALHIAAQEGHVDVVKCLVEEHSAKVSLQANDGLTPLHLSAQTDKLDVVDLLLGYGADLTAKTLSGFTPLHDACYKGHLPVVRLLLQHMAAKDSGALQRLLSSRTVMGCTPLHLAAQQGHLQVVSLLLEYGADPNARNMQGWTAAQIANKQHYLNVFETLAKVTTKVVDWEAPSIEGAGPDGISDGDPALVDGAMVLDSPTQMIDRLLVESEDESDQLLSTPVIMRHSSRHFERLSSTDNSLPHSPSFERLCDKFEYTRSHKGEPKIRISARDSVMDDRTRISTESVTESIVQQRRSQLQLSAITPASSTTDWDFEVENVRAARKPVKAGFLVSFLVDARGGFVEAQRRPDLRFLIPPNALTSPTRIICRLLRPDRVARLPHLNDGEAFACRIMEMSPSNLRFASPILMEVPHFAAVQGRDREILILRCDGGEVWKAHQLEATDQAVQDSLGFAFDQLEPMQILKDRRIQRILTRDIPQFFALVTRFRQEIALIGPEGGILSSTVAPKVQAVFPEGALQKKIKVGLQAQVVPQDVLDKTVGNRIAFSPIVTIEPRRRKFHKPITITIPLPRQPSKGESEGSLPSSLRLLCSIVAGTVPAVWEDVTGSTTLTRQKDCVSFTTTVSARLWLVDAPGVPDVTEMASRVYQESILPPYMGQFAVYGRLPEDRIALEAQELTSNVRRPKVLDPADAELRCVCLIDDAPEKSLESQEKFQLIAVGPYVEVSDSKPYWIETAGDISSYPSHAGQLSLQVQAFRENRLMFPVRVRQPAGSTAPPVGRLAVLREPKGAYLSPEGPQTRKPITTLEIRMPGDQSTHWPEADELEKTQTKLDVPKISAMVGKDWISLAQTLGMTPEDIDMLAKEPLTGEQSGPEADRERCEHMLSLWQQRAAAAGTPIRENMDASLADALARLGRTDAIDATYVPLKPAVMEAEEEMRVLSSPTTYVQKPPSPPPPVTEPQIVSTRSPDRLKREVETLKTYQAELSPPSEELLSKFQEGELMATEELPPTVVDGTPRVVLTEDLPVLLPAAVSDGKPRDDLSLLMPRADSGRPVENDFIVASEGLKRKEMGPVGPADSYARQIAAEELADALGLDADMELVSVIKQSEEPSAQPAVLEDEIKAVKLEPKTEVSPVLLRPDGYTTPSPEPTPTLGGLHVDTESGDELRVPSTENLDEGAFEDAFLAAARQDEEEAARAAAAMPQQFSPGPSGRAGHDVFQGRPEEGFLVEQTEEVLPDGTVVKQQVQTEETVQTVSSHDWEEAELAAAADSERFVVEPPEEDVEIKEVEETLPDGSTVRKLIKIRHVTERITEREVSDEVSENEVQEVEEPRQYPIAATGGVAEGSVGRLGYQKEQTAEDARRLVKDESVPEDKLAYCPLIQQTHEVSKQTFKNREGKQPRLKAERDEHDETQRKPTEAEEQTCEIKGSRKPAAYAAEHERLDEDEETETTGTIQKVGEIKVPETIENEEDMEEIDGGAKGIRKDEEEKRRKSEEREKMGKHEKKNEQRDTREESTEQKEKKEEKKVNEKEATKPAAPVGVEEAEEEEVVKEKEEEEEVIVREEAEAEVKSAVPFEEEVVVPVFEEGVSVFSSVDLRDLRSCLLPVTSSSFVESSSVSEFVPDLSVSAPLPVLSSVDSRPSEFAFSPSGSVCLFDSARSSESVPFHREMLISSDFGEFDSASLCCLPDGGSPLVLGLNVSDFRFDSVSPLASESDLCVPLSEASHLQTYPSPQILPLDGCHLPVCRPIEMDVFETLPASDFTALHLGLTHTFGAFTERVSFIDSFPPGTSGSSSASAPPPAMSDKRGVHIALADVVKFSLEEVKAMLDFPVGVTATTSLSEPPPYAVPSEEVDEAAIHIDTLGSALPVPFARSPQPESVRSLRPDPNLHSATCLALTESVDQEILMPLELPTGLPCVVSAADCLVPARPRPESYPLTTTRRRRTSDTDFRSKLSIASVQTVSSHLHRPLLTACVEELLWAGEDEVLFMADSLTEVSHCIPVVTDVCLLYPRATPCLKHIQQLSVQDPLRPLKHLPSDLMEAELDLTPDFAALPFPLTEKAPTSQTEESIKDVEEEYYSMKVASGLLRTSVPEMRTNSLLEEKSEAVLSLLPAAPVSSAPVSREFVSNEVPPPVCFSSPTLETEQEQQKQQQGEQQGSVTSSETVSNSPSDLDVWVLSKSSSSVEAGSGDEKTAEEATEEGETAVGVGITQPAYSHADGDVTPQQHSCTPLLLSQDEDTFTETLPTATSLPLPVVEDDLSQLAAAAGAALAAEFAQTPDEDEEEEVEGNGCDQEDKESDRLRGLPLTLPTSRSVSKQQGYKTSLATLDRSSRILSRLKFYGIGATPSSSARHEETEETGLEEWGNETGTGGAEETAKELPFATSSEERRLKEEQFLDPNQSVHELMIEEVEMDVEPLSPIQEVGVHEQISSPEDSLDEDDTKLTLPEDFELVPAQEDPDSLSSSSSASLPPTSRLLTRPHNKRFSTSSQRSSEFAAGSVCSDTADESSRDSQSTVVFMGRPDIPPPTDVMHVAHPGEPEPGEFVDSSQSPQQDGSRTTLASVESDLNLISESGREAHSRLPNAASLPRLQQPSPSTPVDTTKLLASQPIASRETKASPVPTSHHLSGLASTPSLLGRSTSSNVYFPQKSRLAKMKVLTTGPGVSAPALTQASDTESRSSSLSEFERLERQMCATSSPEALQRKQSPSSVLHESSSSKTPSSLSEFERLETAMEAGTSSSLSSSGDVQGRSVDVSGGGEGSSQLSLVEFLRVETECQKEDVDDTHSQATSTTTVPSSVTEGVFAPLPYTKIDTIYEDMLAEQACQSLESSRQTDSDLSSSVAAQTSSMLTTAAAEAIEGSACESDSLTQSSLCDSLIPTCSLVESSSLSFREHQPSVNIQYIIREARDVIERGFSRERDSLGEEDSLSSSSDVEGLPARSSSLELDPHPEPSGQSLLPSGLLQTSQDSLDDILPIQGGEDVSISSSSFSQALHSCPMTDSLEDSGAAMASCSRTSTQSPSRTELSKQAGGFDTNLPFALEAQGEPDDYVQEGGEKETKMRQMGSLELRATSDDEALAKRSRTHEGRIPSRLGPSMSSGSLHDASVLGLEAAPVSRTDSNLGSTIFDISEEELGVGGGKSILQPPASLTCSPLRSMTSSQTSEILEVGETVETGTLVETTGFPPVSQLTDLLAQATPQAPQTLAEQKFQPFVFEETEDDFTVITRLADVQTTGSTESHVVPERKTEERQ